MADLGTKKASFISRQVTDALAAVDALDKACTLDKAQWDACAYATGATPAGNNITDADLAAAGFGYMTALQLNQLIGALAAIKATLDQNRGYLEAARP
jgi:hypothetical protein